MSAPVQVDDLNTLQQLIGSEFSGVIQRYISDGEAFIARMKIAYDEANFDDLHQIAHTFKSSSGTLSANYLYQLCNELEQDSLQALETSAINFRQLAKQLTDIETEFEQVRAALLEHLVETE